MAEFRHTTKIDDSRLEEAGGIDHFWTHDRRHIKASRRVFSVLPAMAYIVATHNSVLEFNCTLLNLKPKNTSCVTVVVVVSTTPHSFPFPSIIHHEFLKKVV